MSAKNPIPEVMDDDNNKQQKKRIKWSEFVETLVVEFFEAHKLEKIAVEDGEGNKAKLSRTKDDGVKIEHSSISFL